MSRTDKTRPFRVKVADHPSLLEEDHDHRDGICDLPSVPRFEGWGGGARCTWVPSIKADTTAEVKYCGCRMCTMQVERKQEVRRSRRDARRYAKGGWMADHG